MTQVSSKQAHERQNSRLGGGRVEVRRDEWRQVRRVDSCRSYGNECDCDKQQAHLTPSYSFTIWGVIRKMTSLSRTSVFVNLKSSPMIGISPSSRSVRPWSKSRWSA